MTKRKKSSNEVKEVAEMIASVVVAQPVDSEKATKQKEVKVAVVEQPKKEDKSKAMAEKVIEVPIAKTKPIKNVKIKATASVRGQFRNLRYEIVAGEVYTFPQALAEWLISQGRAI